MTSWKSGGKYASHCWWEVRQPLLQEVEDLGVVVLVKVVEHQTQTPARDGAQ